MIKERYIKAWAEEHPWKRSEQIEQDLLLSRALVAIYSDPFLAERLAFRGGTALHKLYFSPQVRYANENAGGDPRFWTTSVGTPLENTWAGLSFELVCLEHVEQIKRALQIGGVHSRNYAWRCERPEDDSEKGAQIDLLIDRDDGVVNVCEMKFWGKPFAIKEADDGSMRNKIAAFKRETGLRKAVHVTYVTAFGLVRNAYANSVRPTTPISSSIGNGSATVCAE